MPLTEKKKAIEFYQDRYNHGYMEDWPIETKKRLSEIIRDLKLSEIGEAIDFGCGNGVLTDVIRQTLSQGWKTYGTDISETAIANAKKRYPECTFFVAGERDFMGKKFNFLFSHHVLEHVYNLSYVFDEMDGYLYDKSSILHILPCGNEGSFEHSLCLLRKDGINRQLENRYFFEDEGHVRRLNTDQVRLFYEEKGFVLAKEYYGNQNYGAIDWFTQNSYSFIKLLTDTSQALDKKATKQLLKLRFKLLGIWALRFIAAIVGIRFNKKNRTVRDYVILIFGLPFFVFAKPMDIYVRRKAIKEWQTRKTDRNGSEMYLFFER